MKIYRAYKFRLYPNEEQKTIINQTLGCARSVYNHYLTLKKEAYEKNHQTITVQDIIKDIPNLTVNRPWLKEVDSMSLRTSLFDLENAYQKLRNARKYYLHHIIKKRIEENDIIVAEKLQVKKMIEEKNYSKGISDVSFSKIIRQLTYKCRWKSKRFYQVNPYYASSQICHHCGYQNKQVKDVKIRE